MVLEAQGITVRYGPRTVLRDLSFTLGTGQWWMLVGPNGAGKSTLIRAIAQAVPYAGTLTLDGRRLDEMRSVERAREIGILDQQNEAAYAYSVEEIVRLGRYAHRRGALGADPGEEDAVNRALAVTGMEDFRNTSILTLSGGERQRAFLAQVLAQDPRLLILDEPVNHLDLPYQQAIFALIGEWLRQPDRAVLSVVHDLSLARRYGTHALVLREGECLVQGEAKEALSNRVLREAYGMDVADWMKDLLGEWKKGKKDPKQKGKIDKKNDKKKSKKS
ncbi:MAG: ABC transporter ATP-binding protein [Clostridia bacterium]|nr:ABC transporter ATP-binding protein [Clostridia bacterium]